MEKNSPNGLKKLVVGEEELALMDGGEKGECSKWHLRFAVCLPLSRIELLIGDRVQRRETRLVIVDDLASDKFGVRAVHRLAELGYTSVFLLDGGVTGWRSAGLELFSGVNVPSKAFGEFIEHTYETPRLSAAEVRVMLDKGTNMVIVDSRPFED